MIAVTPNFQETQFYFHAIAMKIEEFQIIVLVGSFEITSGSKYQIWNKFKILETDAFR